MAVTLEAQDHLVSRNPSTGQEIGRLTMTRPSEVSSLANQAREAQRGWAAVPIRERVARIDAWRRALAQDADAWADLVRDEVGKPRNESLGELVTTLDSMRWTVKNARRVLADGRVGSGWQRLMLIPSARLSWRPLGLIGMIGTWNYPLLLNASPIAQALAAGNGIVWKPSELATQCGRKLQASLEPFFPAGLVSAVYGFGDVGQALIEAGIDKVVFTGGIPSGRKVLSELGARGVPAIAELSGYDAAIILPDVAPEQVVKALGWAAFVGAGQTCVAIKRIYVVGDARPFAEALATLAAGLRLGDPARGSVDVGPLISEAGRDRFDQMIQRAVAAGGARLAGGSPVAGPGSFYAPTVLLAEGRGPEDALAGCFGPAVVIRSVKSADEAVAEANRSEYALAASVWSSDLRLAQSVADRLEAGVVSINDSVTTSAHAGGPFGGVKASGFGRTKGEAGLREFASLRASYTQRLKTMRPQVYPYSEKLERVIRFYLRFMHGA